MKKEKKKNLWLYGIILFTAIFIASSVIFRVFEIDILPSQFFGALIGVVITAIITVFLLQGQTSNEEQRDRSIKIFEKKQDVYHEFLEKLKEIIKDGEITIASQSKNSNLDQNVDELKDLLFQLGYIQMHTSEENTNKIFERVAKIIQLMNDFNSDGKDKQKLLPEFYASLSEELFGIVSILKNDLYDIETKNIGRERILDLLRECDLFIDSDEFNKYDIQKYFLDELQDQLISKGYSFTKKDFTQDISQFYAKARNRHRWYGFSFEIYSYPNSEEKVFCEIGIENSYYYGFRNKTEDTDFNPELKESLQKSLFGFYFNKNWIFTFSKKYDLDFWKLNSPSFEQLKNPRKREGLISEIVQEIELNIKTFIQNAKKINVG
jgi:gas vesicle protein